MVAYSKSQRAVKKENFPGSKALSKKIALGQAIPAMENKNNKATNYRMVGQQESIRLIEVYSLLRS